MDSMISCKNIFGIRAPKDVFGGIKEIYCSQQFKLISEKRTDECSVKYHQSWSLFYFFEQYAHCFFLS